MMNKKLKQKLRRRKRFSPNIITRLGIVALLLVCALALGWKIEANSPPIPNEDAPLSRQVLDLRLKNLTLQVDRLQSQLAPAEINQLKITEDKIKMALAAGQIDTAGVLYNDLAAQIGSAQTQLANQAVNPNGAAQPDAGAATAAISEEFLPILIYHKTPADFSAQLDWLDSHHYTTISMAQLAAHLRNGAALPAKPVVLSFDDGFADQMAAFAMLQAHRMRATFYVIIGGQASQYCIGIERHPDHPCGDSYLNWDQVTMLDRSGLIEIGAHTVDHLNLASLSAQDAQFQIINSKQVLQQHLGHPVTTFAYPYGSFTAETINAVRAAGFASAVTTIEGTSQSTATLFSLHRSRTALELP